MPSKIESPLGNMSLDDSERKTYVVDDPFEKVDPRVMERFRKTNQQESINYVQSRQEIIREQDSLSPLRKSRLEFLLGLGKIKTEVEIDGVRFGLKSLEAGEIGEAWDDAAKTVNATEIKLRLELRAATLARTIETIDDMPFATVIGMFDPAIIINP